MFSFFNKKKTIVLQAPVAGKAVDIATVPDEVFAGKIVGDGLAFDPAEGVLYSPVNGEIVQVFPTKHAIGLRTAEGLEILLHIGIDTVGMKGEGFESFVTAGQKVKAGDKLMTFDLALIGQKAKSTALPMIITNMDRVKSVSCRYGPVNPHSKVAEVILK
ncbi:PTS system IIA component (Glc family) [Hydrogenispora ethanolica]|jgi:PTS system glucose-specific IIA component|uniref:PTS system IIA component (Glc family) n=1 Tax=Hydrogenispora ethanolica TaxID=1082276 RepID=A0A4V2QDQ9_HYDET|nr:PTS glucose transporter subunit IIA [Hydrogenispora ethanolica]TCL65337.1 PTS system IIA component (Glc family) [Hydrogenispora ethanolica]